MPKDTTDPERRRLRQTAAILLCCHLLELVLTAWLTADLWRQQRRPQCLALLALLLAANLLVATASLVWVHKQLRFGDRCAGRLVCYLLHAVGGALLWRALKLGLVFDARDVREFATLRHLLVHVQTLPVCVVQMYVSYLTGSIGVFPAAPVVVLLASAVTTIVLASSVFSRASGGAGGAESGRADGSALSLPTLPEPADSPLAVPRGAAADWTGADDAWSRLLVAVQALCLLWARLTALATFASLWLGWAVGVVAAHWALAAVWLAAQQYLVAEQRSLPSKAVRVAFLAYLLTFDWQVNRDSASALTVCARPRAAAVYYLTVGLENAVLLGLWVAFSTHIPHTKLATVTGAAATFSVGAVILVMLYCYSAETALGSPTEHVLTAHVGEKSRAGVEDTYVDYKLEEESAAERRRRVGNLYTAFPVLLRSDRSTDNHSANSRNTNTLCELEPGRGEHLALPPRRLRAGSPGSDTASSVSRPAAHCATSTPKRAPWEKTPSRPTRQAWCAAHVCAPGVACHCRLFDQRAALHVLEPRHPAGCHADGRPFRVLCAGCLRAHDPLLTACAPRPAGTAHVHGVPTSVSTTDYPSDSEASDRASLSSDGSAASCSTYTTWPPRSAGGEPLSWLLPPDLTGREYVQAWLQLCGQRPPPQGRPKKKLCRRQHADCPQPECWGAARPAAPPAVRPRKPSRKQRLKGVLLRNKLCRRAGRLRARSVSPRPIDARTATPPASSAQQMVAPPAPPPDTDQVPTFVQNVEAYV